MKHKRIRIALVPRLRSAFEALPRDESGQYLVEYALIAGLIGLGAVVAVTGLSNKIKQAFSSIGSSLASAM